MRVLLILCALCSACGARSGIEVDPATPDASGVEDAGIPDAGIPARDSAAPTVDAGPVADVDGTWIGTLTERNRVFTLQLHKRGNDEVIGTILGGTDYRTIAYGQVFGSSLTLGVRLEDPRLTREYEIRGSFEGESFSGTTTRGEDPAPISWHRYRGPLEELRLLLFEDGSAPEDPRSPVELAVVTNESGELISGGLVSIGDCSLVSCGAGIEGFVRRPDGYSVLAESGSLRLMLELDRLGGPPFPIFSGDVTIEDGSSVSTQPVSAVVRAHARSDHVAAMLRAVAAIADAREAGAGIDESLPIAAAYLHDGGNRTWLLSSMRAERAAVVTEHVDLTSIRSFQSIDDPLIATSVHEPTGLHFHELRVGVDRADVTSTLFEGDTRGGHDELRLFRQEGDSSFLLIGNQREMR